MIKKIFRALIGVVVILSIGSCKKIQEDMIVKGLWTLESVQIDTFPQNQMETFLQHYNTGNDCCRYQVDFQDNDVVFGYYVTHDTFNYVTIGKWKLNKYNEIYVKLDKYVDGNFTIHKVGNKKYEMESDANHIKAFDGISAELDTTYTKLTVKRN